MVLDASEATGPLPDPPRDPLGAPPRRRPESVRRTSSVQMCWPGVDPDGPIGIEIMGAPLLLEGRSRDLRTGADGAPEVVGDAALRTLSVGRVISEIEARPAVPAVADLVGCQAGGRLRADIARLLPDQVEAGTPLHLLLDDLAGATLISGFALIRWNNVTDPAPAEEGGRAEGRAEAVHAVCSGFRAGSSALGPDGGISGIGRNVAAVPPLADPDDPIGFHDQLPHPRLAMRRARRIDVWLGAGGDVEVDSMFRDTCWDPDGTEVAVHEYALSATIHADGVLASVEATPRVLPYPECPLAAPNATWLEGTPVRDLRRVVLERLKGPDCCTHLNDALRALAEVPMLASRLPQG